MIKKIRLYWPLIKSLQTGLLLSTELENLDLPTGPTIVCTFGLLLVISGAVSFLRSRRTPVAS